jgi:predicted transcriptional regulator
MRKILTLRLDDALAKKLERLAKSTRRTKSALAVEAIREYVAMNEWQLRAIKKALQEADESNFASDHEVQTVMNRWAIP